MTPWTIAHQASLPITISWSLLKLVSIEWVIPSNPSLIPFSCPQSFPASRCFPMSWLFPSDEPSLEPHLLKLSHYLLPKTISPTTHRPSSSIPCLVRTAPLEQLSAWGMLAYGTCSLPSPLCLCLCDPWFRRCLQRC